MDSIEESNLMQRAYEFLNEGETEYALQLYDEILSVNPTHIHALNYKGLALASLQFSIKKLSNGMIRFLVLIQLNISFR